MTQSTTRSASALPLPSPKERRRLREAKSLSEEQVAKAVGVTRATVRSWETGRTEPRGRRREAYAKVLGTLGVLADEKPEEPAKPEKPEKPEKPQTLGKPERKPEKPEKLEKPAKPLSRAAKAAAPPWTASPTSQKPYAANTRPKPAVKRAAKPPVAFVREEPTPQPEAEREPEPAPTPAAVPEPELAPAPAPEPGPALQLAGLAPHDAFDALYAYVAPALVRQTYLLTGRHRLSHESVERAFHLAWYRWPEVAVDPDPAGWLRAAAYEYALSPWHRLRHAHSRPDSPSVDSGRRALLDALLELPPSYRRTLLLYDGVGLDLPETAAETEASTPAAANRVLHARAAIAERLPELGETAVLRERLAALAREELPPYMTPARAVRVGGERRAQFWTRAAIAVTALIVAATVFTLATAPTRYEPPLPPGGEVGGVPPPHGGPPQLTETTKQLRQKLLAETAHGPGRLVPQIR
ncbi:helix-turn-helix domain-containing protein [Streptomyces sp. NPDC052236]|uniref:helix-turn-helix domain-containing protein n=1 Tax=Streptomyces sp. NPDC052236 TaxID=3365686 RepID=UPI0037CF1555